MLTFKSAGLVDISDGSSLDYVSNDELLDSLVLWNQTTAVGAVHWYDVSSTVL